MADGKSKVGGERFNDGKPPLWLVPWSVLRLRINDERRNAAFTLWAWCRGCDESDWRIALAARRPRVIEEASHILAFGAKKYAPYNWEKGLSFVDTVSSGLRHAVAPGIFDGESGLPHFSHLCCNVLFAAHFNENLEQYARFDDRPEWPLECQTPSIT